MTYWQLSEYLVALEELYESVGGDDKRQEIIKKEPSMEEQAN